MSKRLSHIIESDGLFIEKIELLQKQFGRAILSHLEQELIFEGKVIKSVSKNYSKLNSLHLVAEQFRKEKVNPFLKWLAKRYLETISLNNRYFSKEVDVSPNIHKEVEKTLLARIGIVQTMTKTEIISGGWLSDLGNFQDPYLRVKDVTNNAIANEMSIESFRKILTKEINDAGRQTVKHHFFTNAYDSFAQYDRIAAKGYADSLGLRVARYSGGTIKTSREECEKRNGKLFTLEEMELWRDKDWKGKNKDYEPLRDLGGHNCRHTLNYISELRAIRERPELKDYFDELRSRN